MRPGRRSRPRLKAPSEPTSSPAGISLTAFAAAGRSPSCRAVPDTRTRFVLSLAGEAEHARIAARNATFAASTAVPSKPVYGFAPLTAPSRRRRRRLRPAAGRARRGSAQPDDWVADRVQHGRVAERLGHERLPAFHLPGRTSDGANLWNVSGKSMIYEPAGLPPTSWPASLSVRLGRVPGDVDADLAAELLVLGDEQLLERVPNASLRALTSSVAPLPKASIAAARAPSPAACPTGTRARDSRCLMSESCGALEVGKIWTTRLGIVMTAPSGLSRSTPSRR